MTTAMPNPSPFADFESASRAVLVFLSEYTGLGLWMMTRTEGEDWIVLQSESRRYAIADGDVFRWADSCCSMMVTGDGPQAAPRVSEVPEYVNAPVTRQVPMGAYLGVPVLRGNGELFGTLCAFDPSPQPVSLDEQLPLVQLLARLLGTILEEDMRRIELSRALETTLKEASQDPLTGLLNRRGWEERLEVEERRARRYGSPAVVFIIDLDRLKQINDTQGHDAGDDLLVRTGTILRETVRESDQVARIGGDEFAVLCMECDAQGGEAIEAKIRHALEAAAVEASIGWCSRNPREDITAAVSHADRAMLAEKQAGRAHEG